MLVSLLWWMLYARSTWALFPGAVPDEGDYRHLYPMVSWNIYLEDHAHALPYFFGLIENLDWQFALMDVSRPGAYQLHYCESFPSRWLKSVGSLCRSVHLVEETNNWREEALALSRLSSVDFGDIGDLLKIRIEVDGSRVSPDYFLNKVELRDLDAEESMACYVGKWLRWKGNEKHVQPYREFPVFRAAFEPLNIITYEGKMRLASLNRRHLLEENGQLQIFGEIGETGRFPVSLQLKPNQKTEIAFKTEAASIGRIHCVRLFVTSDEIGEQLYEGLCVLQAIYDRRGVVGINVASNWLVDRVLIRESPHAPYRFVLKHSRVKEVDEDGELFKEIVLSEMEGLPTKVTKKKARKREKPQYILSMVITEYSTLIPNVTLCGDHTTVQMSVIDKAPVNGVISFQAEF